VSDGVADAEVRRPVDAPAPFGTPHKEIAGVLRIDLELLRKDDEEELETRRIDCRSAPLEPECAGEKPPAHLMSIVRASST